MAGSREAELPRQKRRIGVSLTVSPELQQKAMDGKVSDAEFVTCIQASLPYAWSVVARLAAEREETGAPFADNREVPGTEAEWGELFRLVASDSMRAAVERHYDVRLAFQNCCRVALFDRSATEEYERFTSPQAQLLNQRPELVNC